MLLAATSALTLTPAVPVSNPSTPEFLATPSLIEVVPEPPTLAVVGCNLTPAVATPEIEGVVYEVTETGVLRNVVAEADTGFTFPEKTLSKWVLDASPTICDDIAPVTPTVPATPSYQASVPLAPTNVSERVLDTATADAAATPVTNPVTPLSMSEPLIVTAPDPAPPFTALLYSDPVSTGTTTLVSLDTTWNPGDSVEAVAAEPEPIPEPEDYEETYVAEETYEEESASRSYNRGSSIVDTALSYVGYPYVWGATGPYAFDCSGLTQAVYAAHGIYIPRTAAQQGYSGVAVSDPVPGDLVVWTHGGHVAIYLGDGMIVHASSPGVGVVVGSLYGSYYFVRY